MEELLLDIIAHLRRQKGRALTSRELEAILMEHNRGVASNVRHVHKRQLLPYYLHVKEREHGTWQRWDVNAALEERLLATLRLKPRRTASGVATITVLTRPHPCSSDCIYCPADLRMPKSYLASEPACQRAEQNFFDPFLQVSVRLQALHQMGHSVDKVELIVLGGTWSNYPEDYQLWFVRELFRALNEWPCPVEELHARAHAYRMLGFSNSADECARRVAAEQARIGAGEESYNQGFTHLYAGPDGSGAAFQTTTMEGLEREQRRNETAAHRVVGLVIETRPDAITPELLTRARRLGCTKIQMGIQSTRQEVLDANHRATTIAQVRRAFSLVRLYGFKLHTHLMVNLLGSTPDGDKRDFGTFVSDPGFLPDEIKLYPCALVAGTQLVREYQRGRWRPYGEGELVDVLVADTLATPSYVRISRMIRDISATDILVGNKKTNLRQMVEGRIRAEGLAGRVRDIRFREIACSEVELDELAMDDVRYETTVSTEHFLQWVTPEGRIAGFLRLSLPRWDELTAGALDVRADELPVRPGEAMIREVHVYGKAAHLGRSDSGSQHQGLGRALVARSRQIARDAGYVRLNVISSVGTREYYRHLGFEDAGLYQRVGL